MVDKITTELVERVAQYKVGDLLKSITRNLGDESWSEMVVDWDAVTRLCQLVAHETKGTVEGVENTKDWFATGEFPPVGTVCEVLYDGMWEKTKIIGWDDDLIVITTEWDELHDYDSICAEPTDFRPLKTERQRLIQEAVNLIGSKEGNVSLSAVQILVDAGMLKMPEDK